MASECKPLLKELPKDNRSLKERLHEVTADYLPLAWITFGGPAAHIAILHDRFVVQKRWLSESMFAELLAISSGLPGPASTQLAYTVALIRDGVIPAIWAFCLWSLPGGIFMGALGTLVGSARSAALPEAVLYMENGLAAAAVALVALAAYNLGSKLCSSNLTKGIAVASACATVNFTAVPWMIPVCMVLGGAIAYGAHLFEKPKDSLGEQSPQGDIESAACKTAPTTPIIISSSKTSSPAVATSSINNNSNTTDPDVFFSYNCKTGLYVLAAWALLFAGAVALRSYSQNRPLQVLGTFYYVGSIIFGGGPVMLPLLYNYVVETGWIASSDFLLGLAVINAMPGPNFNFAVYCGALALRQHYGVAGAIGGGVMSWLGMFLPGLLIKTAVLPLWRRYRGFPTLKIAFQGVNAAAVGLVFTATFLLWQKALSINGAQRGPMPVGDSPLYVALVAVSFVAVAFMKVSSPLMIGIGGSVGLLHWAYQLYTTN